MIKLPPTKIGERLYRKTLVKKYGYGLSGNWRNNFIDISITSEGIFKNAVACGKMHRSKSYGLLKSDDKEKWHYKKMKFSKNKNCYVIE